MPDGKDYGELGIFRKATGGNYPIVLVNGQEAATRAPVRQFCPNNRVEP
jgi:hypothetical protein